MSEQYTNIKIKALSMLLLFVGIWLATDVTAIILRIHHMPIYPTIDLPMKTRVGIGCMGIFIMLAYLYEHCRRPLQEHVLLVISFSTSICCLAIAFFNFYNPCYYFLWIYEFGYQTNEVIWYAGIASMALFGSIAGIYHIKHIQRKKTVSDLHGSSRFSTNEEVGKTGLLSSDNRYAIYIGALDNPSLGNRQYLTYTGESNVFVLGPSRSGKGAGLVIPTLLSYEGNCINTDLKMENWHYTAGYRRAMGQTVLKFDFTCTDGTAATFNPLFEIRKGLHEVRDVQNLVDMIADPHGEGKPDHWTDTANDLLVSIILHVLYYEKDKSLPGIRHFISNVHMTESELFEYMLTANHDPDGHYGWLDPYTHLPTKTHPLVAAGAKDMLNRAEAERSGIISTFKRLLKIYRDPVLANNIRTSDFSAADLIDSEKKVSLYIYMPPSDKSRAKPLIRLVLNQILTRLTETWEAHGTQSAKQRPLLLLMDEFPQLGRLDFFESALAYTAGYGIKTCLICQDLSQVYQAYGQHQSIMSNCELTLTYAPNKLETAQHLSTMLGDQTIIKETKNYSGKRLSNYLHQVSTGEQEHKRKLMTPDELMRLPFTDSLIFKTGFHPIKAKKSFYFHDPIFQERAIISPPLASDKLTISNEWHDVKIMNDQTEPSGMYATEQESDLLTEGETDDLL